MSLPDGMLLHDIPSIFCRLTDDVYCTPWSCAGWAGIDGVGNCVSWVAFEMIHVQNGVLIQ